MNRARAALCGLALALAGCAPAPRAPAPQNDHEALLARCIGTMIETRVALQEEFPERGGGEGPRQHEAALLDLRKAQADPRAALWDAWRHEGRSRSEVVSDTCALADALEAGLDAIRRGDDATAKAEMCRLIGRLSYRSARAARAALPACQ